VARFDRVLKTLKEEERSLDAQLDRIRRAIAALQTATAGTVRSAVRRVRTRRSRRRTFTAAQRRDISQRMKKYWAERRKK
jgi:hypothetical protein